MGDYDTDMTVSGLLEELALMDGAFVLRYDDAEWIYEWGSGPDERLVDDDLRRVLESAYHRRLG